MCSLCWSEVFPTSGKLNKALNLVDENSRIGSESLWDVPLRCSECCSLWQHGYRMYDTPPRKMSTTTMFDDVCIIFIYIQLYTHLEPVCPLFWWLNPPKQCLFQSKQGPFGFQVYIYIYLHTYVCETFLRYLVYIYIYMISMVFLLHSKFGVFLRKQVEMRFIFTILKMFQVWIQNGIFKKGLRENLCYHCGNRPLGFEQTS